MTRIDTFGTLPDGQEVQVVTLRAGELIARVLTFGAVLQDLRHAGCPWPLILGSDRIEAYLGPLIWCGAVVGPVANRIGGATTVIGGRLHRFRANDGANLLHSGAEGISNLLWRIEAADAASVTLGLNLPAGFGGFPGNRQIRARYALEPPARLELTLSAETDAATLMNLAHHPYWCLDGRATTAHHRLQVAASRYLPLAAQTLPGDPMPVEGGGYDLRQPRALPELPALDHNYCLDPAPGAEDALPAVARLWSDRGPLLKLATDAPGLQVYDGRGLDSRPFPGLTGTPYRAHAGIALEPQLWPDAPAHEDFPPITLAPRQSFRQRLSYSFSEGPGPAETADDSGTPVW